MSKYVVAVNGSPRRNWNTDILVSEAARGAEAGGLEVKKFDLYRLEKYTGCISCFACKRPASLGRCACRDGLTPVLDAIRGAEGLILGTPNYLGDISAGLRALYERLIFQALTYKLDPRSYNEHMIPTLLIMTSNAPDDMYLPLLERYRGTFDAFVGPTQVFVSGNTLQVNDYTPFDWTMFDAEAKKARRETVFPQERQKCFELGAGLVRG